MYSYRPDRLLGKGTFGEVWLGVQIETTAHVAMKYLLPGQLAYLQRFIDEARTLHALRGQQHVVSVVDFRFDCERPFIVLEFCDGGSLRSWVGKRPWNQCIGALRHAANGLAAVHAIGAHHRDIKPENLLVASIPGSKKVNIKLADFGVARCPVPVSGNLTYSLQGTPGYIAPEVLADNPFSTAADVYSLGITGIELITSRRSVRALDSAKIPDEVKNLLRSMCANDPSQRPSAHDLISALSEVEKVEELVEVGSSGGGGGRLLGALLVVGAIVLASGR